MSWWSCQFSMKCQNHLLHCTVIQKHPFSILTFYLYHIYNTRYLRSPYYRFKHENIWHFNITFFAFDFFAHLPRYLIYKKNVFTHRKKQILNFHEFLDQSGFFWFIKIDKQESFWLVKIWWKFEIRFCLCHEIIWWGTPLKRE